MKRYGMLSVLEQTVTASITRKKDTLALPQPQHCLTASGALIVDGKILLVKHKKLGIWLTPGGHLEEGELPHQAAEREFLEETGIKVTAINLGLSGKSTDSQYYPTPIICNLHWISRHNYDLRVGKTRGEMEAQWKRGCEQHFDMKFLVEPIDDAHFQQNTEETDGIGWFAPEEVAALETHDDIKSEIFFCFDLVLGEE